ncbi:MAG: DUF3147 family protein [Syntrophomonadaceae bacterium]|nr:DUF3147 family protein [Syntrophomonadaceae bacterium]
MSFSVAPVILRFILGGGAVVASTIVARSFGGRIGGIFAAFPAVYLAAVLSLGLDYSGQQLLEMSRSISHGALIGMIADVFCALAASRFILKHGWGKGLVQALVLWCVLAPVIYFTWQLI